MPGTECKVGDYAIFNHLTRSKRMQSIDGSLKSKLQRDLQLPFDVESATLCRSMGLSQACAKICRS